MAQSTALVVWQPAFPLWAQAEQRQIERWAADGVLLCPWTCTPCIEATCCVPPDLSCMRGEPESPES